MNVRRGARELWRCETQGVAELMYGMWLLCQLRRGKGPNYLAKHDERPLQSNVSQATWNTAQKGQLPCRHVRLI